MKRVILILIAFATVSNIVAQETSLKNKNKIDLSNRAGDHIMLQLSNDRWTGAPDSIKSHQKGLARGANVYVMLDKPFKSNPQYSVGFGVGVGTSNIYFKNYAIDLTTTNTKLPFNNLDSANHFKKYKISTTYLEVPVELRFTKDPTSNKSLKAALGVKVGTLVNVHTKGKTLVSKSGTTINSYTEEESNKRFFNSTKLAVTGRVGLGNFSIFASYQINNLLKDGIGPQIKPLQIGICLSGL